MAVQSQKKKILCLMQILLERTDENHIMSAGDLCVALREYGVLAERKSIYSDIEVLREFGLDIVSQKGSHAGYYVGSREFELPELKLLVDSVQSSKFITTKKSEELIKKLERLASRYEARKLQRNVFIYNRPKSGNETIYYSVDQIHAAMLAGVRISFCYAEWTLKKELKAKKGGAVYIVSPWALTWSDENYYLIAYDETTDSIKHYRVDKMQQMKLLNRKRLGKERFQDFDLAAFAKKTFSMYGGRDETVTLLCHNSLAGVILDRFGTDVIMVPADEEHFRVKIVIAVSRQFFGWITGIGEQMRIAGPVRVQEEYRKYLKNIMSNYE